jgi:hypothetical protein
VTLQNFGGAPGGGRWRSRPAARRPVERVPVAGRRDAAARLPRRGGGARLKARLVADGDPAADDLAVDDRARTVPSLDGGACCVGADLPGRRC